MESDLATSSGVTAKSRSVDDLLRRIRDRSATVGVIGCGYVGLPLLRAFSLRGFSTIGFDVDPAKIELLNQGGSYIRHIPAEDVAAMVVTGRFSASADFTRTAEADILILCVPTPLGPSRTPDLSFVIASAEEILPRLRPGQLIILESTTYPGTTSDVVVPILERSGLVSGRDFHIAYSPEREDPGNSAFRTEDIPKIVGADDPVALELTCALYDQIVPRTVPVSSTKVAEAAKLTENIFRAVNIALANELKEVYGRMGIDVWEVIDAAATKPFGFMPFYPGPGLGGHCIPIDPLYLSWKARVHEVQTRFIELADEINSAMPYKIVDAVATALHQRQARSLTGSRILLVGLAYKRDVGDLRESPAIKILELLEAAGAKVDYYDPYVVVVQPNREYPGLAGRTSVEWSPGSFSAYHAAVIATDHRTVAYEALVAACPLIIDTRNATRHVAGRAAKVILA